MRRAHLSASGLLAGSDRNPYAGPQGAHALPAWPPSCLMLPT